MTLPTVRAMLITTTVLTPAFTHASMPDRWVLQELTSPDGLLFPTAHTDDGLIGGVAYGPDGRRPFILDDDVLRVFSELPVDLDIFPLNQQGQGLAADRSTGRIVRYSPAGVEEMTTLPSVNGATIYLSGPDPQGNFAGAYPDTVTGYTAFAWSPQQGFEVILAAPLATFVAGINESGTVLGYGYNAPPTSNSCFVYADGIRRDFEDAIPGRITPVMINNQDQVLALVQSEDDSSQYSYRLVDTSDFSSVEINVLTGGSTVTGTLINNLGQAAFASGGTDGAPAVVDLWSPDDAPERLMTLEDTEILRLEEFDDSGTLRAHRFEDQQYQSTLLLASLADGVMNLNQRVVGYAEADFLTLLSTAATTDRRMTVSWLLQSETQGRYGVLRPARPGDVDGDGRVDVTDVLAVVSAWGPRPLTATCGPDLDMNGRVEVGDLLQTLDQWD